MVASTDRSEPSHEPRRHGVAFRRRRRCAEVSACRHQSATATQQFQKWTGIDDCNALCDQVQFLQVEREVEDQLNRISRIVGLIVGIHIRFELPAISQNLMPALLEREHHMGQN